jgi:hypothetical protein
MMISKQEIAEFISRSSEVERALSHLAKGFKLMEDRQIDRPILMTALRLADEQLRGYRTLLLEAKVDVNNVHHRPKAKLYLFSEHGRKAPEMRRAE